MTSSALAGTGALARLAFRRDRIMLPVWVYVITAAIASNSYSLNKLYPRPRPGRPGGQRRSEPGAGLPVRPAVGGFPGRGERLAVRGVGGHLRRADEHLPRDQAHQGGRGAGPSWSARRRWSLAALTAALLVAVAANVVLTALLVIVLIVLGLPVAGSVAFALAITTCGLVFAAVAALAAQLAAGARAARGIALGMLGAAYLLRAVGDASGASGVSWLAWLSPLGWTEQIRPYTADQWQVLALPLALAAATTAAAYVLAVVRDYGAGRSPDRPGRPAASAWLRGPRYLPLGLAWRLQRGTLYGWALGFASTFAASGAAAKGIGSLLGGSAQLRNAFTRLGGQAGITDAYLAAIMSLAGLAAAAYATSAVLRLRTEETGGQAEPLLATATSRIGWGLSHVVVAVAGAAALLAVAGVAAGLGYGLRTGSAGSEVARLLGAAMVQLPASLAVAGAAVLLFGLAPRASVAGAWAVVGVVVLIALFGQVLRCPSGSSTSRRSPTCRSSPAPRSPCPAPARRCSGWAWPRSRWPRRAWPPCAAAISADPPRAARFAPRLTPHPKPPGPPPTFISRPAGSAAHLVPAEPPAHLYLPPQRPPTAPKTAQLAAPGRATRCHARTKRTSVTLSPSVPDHTAWMSQPCSWSDMAETFTPYPRNRTGRRPGITGHRNIPGTLGGPGSGDRTLHTVADKLQMYPGVQEQAKYRRG